MKLPHHCTLSAYHLSLELQKHEAASLIQLTFGAYTQRKKFLQQRKAAMVIQRQYRAWHLAQIEKAKYNKIRKLVICLQSLCRGWLVRKKVLLVMLLLQHFVSFNIDSL